MKTGVEKKNNGQVKNRKGVQKEEGVKTFVYDKRNRAITCAFSRDLLGGAPRAALCGIGLFLVRFCGNFFFQSTVLRFSESKYAVILNFMTR